VLPACASDAKEINVSALAIATIPLCMVFSDCLTANLDVPGSSRQQTMRGRVASTQQVWSAFPNGAIINQTLPTISPWIDDAKKAITARMLYSCSNVSDIDAAQRTPGVPLNSAAFATESCGAFPSTGSSF
jgi:hypothetical protein